MRHTFRLLFCCVLLVSCAFAQSTPAAPARTVIRAGNVLDVRTGRMLPNQTIVVEDGKVVSVGALAGPDAVTNATIIDLSGKTVLPGLIDAHTHLTMNPNFGYSVLAISVPRQALIGAHNAKADAGRRIHDSA